MPTAHAKIYRFISKPRDLAQIRMAFKDLRNAVHKSEECDLKLVLHDMMPDYSPFLVPWEKIPPPAAPITNLGDYRRAAETGLTA